MASSPLLFTEKDRQLKLQLWQGRGKVGGRGEEGEEG